MENSTASLEITGVDLSFEIYKKLKYMIVSGELKPGTKLKQEHIAEMFGVSRMPLHRSFQILENEMLVMNIPRRGYFVTDIDDAQLADAFECRDAIEGLAVRRLAKSATPEVLEDLKACFKPFMDSADIDIGEYMEADQRFHSLLLERCGNQLVNKFEMFGTYTSRTYRRGLLRPPQETLEEHLAIIDAIASHDQERAEDLIHLHLRKSAEKIQ